VGVTADHLPKATGWLEAELVAQRQVDAELGAMRTSAARVRDLVHGDVDRLSSLATSLSMVAELLEGWIDTTGTNGVY
jgi:hypothetical protein